jgi:hypothetical protein
MFDNVTEKLVEVLGKFKASRAFVRRKLNGTDVPASPDYFTL